MWLNSMQKACTSMNKSCDHGHHELRCARPDGRGAWDYPCVGGGRRDLDVDDLVANERLQEDADKTNQPVLHEPVLDVLARGDAIRDVQMHKLGG